MSIFCKKSLDIVELYELVELPEVSFAADSVPFAVELAVAHDLISKVTLNAAILLPLVYAPK